MKRRWILWLPLLVASHAALYFLAPHAVSAAQGKRASGSATAATTIAPAKSHDRGPESATPSTESRGQLERMIHALLSNKDLTDEQKQQGLRELMRDWIRRDLRSVLDLMYGPNTRGRFGDMFSDYSNPELVREEMLRRPEEVWEWIRSGRFGFARRDVTEFWSEALLAAGQRDTVMAVLASASPGEQHDLYTSLCQGAPAWDLKRLRAMLDGELAKNPGRDSLLDFYAKRKAALSKGDLKLLLEGEVNPSIRNFLATEWVERDFEGMSPAQMAGRLAELPAELQGKAFLHLLDHGKMASLGDLATLVNEAQRLGLWGQLEDGGVGDHRSQLVSLLDHHWNPYRSPQEIVEALGTVQDPESRTQTLMAAGMRWMQTRPADFLKIIENWERGPDRDAFIAGTIMYGSSSSAEFPILTGAIADEALRAKIIQAKKAEEEKNTDYFGPGPAEE